ncbi:PBP/GOBP family [Popillia japonica]|uniref:PBP/GOBP family n=1 Tax=Popillia japonica TaxID=7064 RepID=A0AAW1L5J5_POPJA
MAVQISVVSSLVLIYSLFVFGVFGETQQTQKCKVPPSAPKNIEKVINICQDEIRTAILSEALQVFNFNVSQNITRTKRQVFSEDETKIAGCLLHCVYRRMNALNEEGFPTIEGLVSLYAEGVKDRGYLLATLQSVATCLSDAHKKHLKDPKAIEGNANQCSVAFDVFNCVSDRIGEYCGQTP